MNIEELLAKFNCFDEMEADTGMNIAESMKDKKEMYNKAISALEAIQNDLWDGVSPSNNKLDEKDEEFNLLINKMIGEIHSRSLAFDESLNETVVEKDNLTDGNVVKTDLANFGIAINADEDGIYLGTVVYGTQAKRLSTTDYDLAGGEDIVADVTKIVERNLNNMEKEVKDLMNLI